MNFTRKTSAVRNSSPIYPRALTFFPLTEKNEDLCQNLNDSLFQLEKDLAYFSFAVQEIQDITCPAESVRPRKSLVQRI